MRKLPVIALCAVFGLSAGSAWAGPPDKSYKDWFGHLALGYDLPQGKFGDVVGDDWSINGGATYWPQGKPIGWNFDLAWAEFDLKNSAVQAINSAIVDGGGSGSISGGSVDVWSGTVNALWSPKKANGGSNFYLTVGVGAYYLEGRLTENGIVVYPPYCDYYWCYPGGIGTGDYVVGSEATTEFGWNAGVGFTFDVGVAGSQIYLEAKYQRVEANTALEFVPITLGYRW